MAISDFRLRSKVLRQVLGLGMVFVAGCTQLWGGRTKADPQNCVVSPEICSENQRCSPTSEQCEALPITIADLRPLPATPGSYIFPGGKGSTAMMLTWPRDAKYALAALDPATKIYYTTDGTNPAAGQSGTTSAVTPALNGIVPGGTTIRWFADYGAAFQPETVRDFTAVTNTTYPEDMGYIPEPLKFQSSNRPIAVTYPGAQVNATVAVQAWHSTAIGYCPGCFVQYVVAVAGIGAVACMPNVELIGAYPGATNTVTVSFTAPSQPGLYRIYSGITMQFGCDGTVVEGPDIGALVVQ